MSVTQEQFLSIKKVCLDFGLNFNGQEFDINSGNHSLNVNGKPSYYQIASYINFTAALRAETWLTLSDDQHESLDNDLGDMSKRLVWSPQGFGVTSEVQQIVNDHLDTVINRIVNSDPAAMEGREAA